MFGIFLQNVKLMSLITSGKKEKGINNATCGLALQREIFQA